MHFKKLFQVLVLGGAAAVAASGCAQANAQEKGKKPPVDAGSSTDSSGGGVKGW